MDSFRTLFGSLLALVYHCFDRIVIQGYLPLLTRPEHIVHFFRDVHRIAPITKEVLIQRTTEYKAWVEAFACDHGVPIAWAEAGIKKEDHVRPYYGGSLAADASACTSSFAAWNKGASSRSCRRRLRIRRIGSLNGHGDASRISTSTS